METSVIVSLVERQRLAILERDAKTSRLLARRWLELERGMEAEILRVAADLEGVENLTEAMILRNQRYKDLMIQARAQYARYADDFDETVQGLQAANMSQGIQDSASILNATQKEFGIGFNFQRLNVNAIESMVGFSVDGSPLRGLLMKSYGEAVNGLTAALLEGVSKGWGVNQTAKYMSDKFGIGLDRALLIARTEQMRSYRLGSLEQYKESGVVMQYKRLAKKDDKTCLGCLFQDGEIYSTQEEFAEHPNGRCVLVPVVMGNDPQWVTGKEWFAGLSEERQKNILGNERFALWQSGTALDDFSTLKPNTTWGGSFVPTPLNVLNNG